MLEAHPGSRTILNLRLLNMNNKIQFSQQIVFQTSIEGKSSSIPSACRMISDVYMPSWHFFIIFDLTNVNVT